MKSGGVWPPSVGEKIYYLYAVEVRSSHWDVAAVLWKVIDTVPQIQGLA